MNTAQCSPQMPKPIPHRTVRSGALVRLASVLLLCLGTVSALAQVAPIGEKQMGEPTEDKLPAILKTSTVHQHLDQQLPLNAAFVDDQGRPVTLGQYFDGRHPVLLAMVYYRCQVLCSEELRGLTGALEMVSYKPGTAFQIVAISIDPSETPAMAAAKKREMVAYYGHKDTADGWHFLTGKEPAIEAVAAATGFGYVKTPGPDGKSDQFAHSSAIQIVTPEGRIAQYYMGVEYSPQDLRLGLIDASNHKIGTIVDTALTYCYRYDPTLQRHSIIVARIVQGGCLLTILVLGGYMITMFRRDAKQAKLWKNQPRPVA